MFDKKKFLAVLIMKGKSIEDVANHLGVSKQTLYNKINGRTKFYLDEVSAIRDFLELSDMVEIFFADKLT